MRATHTHISAVHIGTAFVGVLLAGTLWKLAMLHAAASDNPSIHRIGTVGLFQFG